mgnify:CR=1 FL=1|jgi:hypothetical protein
MPHYMKTLPLHTSRTALYPRTHVHAHLHIHGDMDMGMGMGMGMGMWARTWTWIWTMYVLGRGWVGSTMVRHLRIVNKCV